MAIETVWSISGLDVRYIGDAHGGASPEYYSVIEMHRFLQDLADDEAASGNDEIDIVSSTPSERSTDNIIELKNGYNIDDTSAEYLFDGSIIQAGGDTIYDGIVNFGNTVNLQIHQDGAVITNDFWNQGGAGLNPDATLGISHRFLVKVRDAAADTDGRRLIGTSRNFGFTYAEFPIGGGTARGNNVLALSESNDLNNNTAEGTVSGWTTIVNNTEGYVGLDVTGDTVNEFYYSDWTRAALTINQLFERLKWLTREGSVSTLYGLNGELFRGITNELDVTQLGGTFVEPESVTWTGGSGQIFAVNNTTAATKVWIQVLTGTAPSSGTITGNGGATATVTGNTARDIATPFVGTSTGSAIIGSFGLGITPGDLTASDQLFDLTDTPRTPPNNVQWSLGGLVVSEDRVLVTNDNATAIDLSQFTLNGLLSGGEATINVNEAVPADTPTPGTIRVFDGTNYVRVTYTGTGANSFTGCTGTPAAANGANTFLSYIDKLAGAVTESFTVVYDADRTLFVRVRDGGVTPIKTYETTSVLGSGGGSATASRITDA